MANDKEKTWDNLTKDYLTTEQKIDIIREHNTNLSNERFKKCIASLRDYLEQKKDEWRIQTSWNISYTEVR